MLTAPWTKTIRDTDKVALIDGIEYRDDGVLDDFVASQARCRVTDITSAALDPDPPVANGRYRATKST
jgi:hypothetical protein